ncbi:MAG: hypothetical protein PHC62_07500 [Candidatus Izemoplasmatales bacterium]|nr:hypothetical protein [Candidatus Izemoplasmatales bacterium]
MLLFWKSKLNGCDLDIEVETLKNNIVLFLSSFLPFIAFLLIFKDMSWYFKVSIALICTGIVFIIANFVKKVVDPIYDKIQIRKSEITDLTIYAIYFFFAIFIVTSFFIFVSLIKYDNIKINNYKYFTYAITSIDGDVIDYYYDENNLYIYTSSKELSNEQITVFELETNEILYTQDIEYMESSVDRNDFTSSRFVKMGSHLVLMPLYGAYDISLSGASLISLTEGYSTTFFESNGQDYLLVDHLDNTYDVINESYQLSNSIDTSSMNMDLIIINDTLFLTSMTHFF